MKSLLVFSVAAVMTGAMVGCGNGGYTYSPPPPPAPGTPGGGEVDPNAGVSVDPELMNQGMGQK